MSIMLKILGRLLKWTAIGVGTIVLLLVVYFGIQAIKYPDYLTTFPTTSSAFQAKEICSCLFVEGQSEAMCGKYAPGMVSGLSDGYAIDFDQKRVTSTGLGRSSAAHFVEARYGCVLENPQ